MQRASRQYPAPPLIAAHDAVRSALAIAIGALIVLLQIDLGDGFPHNLDAGWGEILAWGIQHGAQWGRDLVFTYGPLGFAAPGLPFDPATYWAALVLQLAFALATAALIVVALRRLPLAAVIAFAAAAIVPGWSWSTSATLIIIYPLAAVALEQLTRRADARPLARHAAVAALAAFTALQPLIKFSVFPLWLVWLPLALVMLWRAGDRRLLATFVAASVAAPIIAWIACGQNPLDLGAWLYWSWQIAIAYPAAMAASPTSPITDWTLFGATVLWLAAIAAWMWRARRSARRLVLYAMFAAAVVLAYRAGATRADNGHLALVWSVYLWCAALLAGLGYQDGALKGVRQSLAVLVLVMLTLTLPRLSRTFSGHTLSGFYSGRVAASRATDGARTLLHPMRGYRERMQRWTRDCKALALPAIRQAVGRDTVDALLNAQSALLANGLNYRPRPVFQSYSAYSGALAELNGRFFLSSRAPEWAMLDWSTIDADYPTTEDPRALIRVLQDYRPVLAEGGFILFRRAAEPVRMPLASGPKRALPIRFAPAAPTPIPTAKAWFARFDVRLTAYGKLEALLFRPPKLGIEVGLNDGSIRHYAITPSIAGSGFLLSPALASNAGYLNWVHGDDSRYVTQVRLTQAKSFNHRSFTTDGTLRLYPVTLPSDAPYTPALYGALFPGFDRLPTTVTGTTRIYTVDHAPVLFLPPPGALTFRLPAGTYKVAARYGLMPNALTNAACLAAHPDGIGFQILAAGDMQQPPTAYLDPFADPAHRYAADFSGAIKVGPEGPVTVRFTTGRPGSDGACDWSWIRGLRFTPQPTDAPSVPQP